jgi:hypothetical protein
MFWNYIGNKWLRKWFALFQSFQGELRSVACANSPLTAKEKETLNNLMIEICKINNQIYNRLKK